MLHVVHQADASGDPSTIAAMPLIPTHDSPGLGLASLAVPQAFRSGSYTYAPVSADWAKVSRKLARQSNDPLNKSACWTQTSLELLAQEFDMLRTKFPELRWERACTRF